ncbi:MAG TPA: hypothetical protein VMW16_09055 [Sedimentisphaerales bacterium]|nr:hypothetical protein [Sedimentisphaerales bacterium]
MLKVFWYCLDGNEKDRQFVTESFAELTNLLIISPAKVNLKATLLDEQSAKIADEVLSEPPKDTAEPLSNCYFDISKKVSRDKCTPILVYCRPNSYIAEAIRKNQPLAKWGYTQQPYISAVYNQNNKYILWHEALHLFGADDCYDCNNPNSRTTCELRNCLMQYAPTKETVGEWPFLCKENVERIRNWSDKHK